MKKETFTGLVVCGGASTRMGVDKSLLQYHDQPQRYHVADLMREYCDPVFLSLNPAQSAGGEVHPALIDLPEYRDTGPVAALLTAFHYFPHSSFIVLGCDYPLLTRKELQHFIFSIGDKNIPKAFYNQQDGFYEPLLAFYPASIAPVLQQYFEQGNTSLQRILNAEAAARYFPEDLNSIRSIDRPEDHARVVQWLHNQKGKAG